jgi:hypothetical protein
VRSARLALLLLVVAVRAAGADVVHLKNGGRLVGRVEDDGDRVRVVMAGGTMTLAKDRIESVERGETPAEEVARRRRDLAPGDAAAAATLARFAAGAGLVADEGELLQIAAAWAPDDAKLRAELAGWRVFDRPLARNEPAETALAAAAGKDAGVYLTPHWRIAFATDLGVARRRGEMLEAAWRKFREFVDRTGIAVRAIDDRMECVVFRDHAEWLRAAGLPETDVSDLVGIYAGESRRILLYDARTSPAAKQTQQVVTDEIAALADARAAVEKQRGSLAQLERALTEALAPVKRDETRVADLRKFIAETKAALSQNEDAIASRTAELERFRADVTRHFAEENVSASTHEACHQIAFALGVSRAGQPTWLTEGLATLFEPQNRTTFVLEAANQARLSDARAAWANGDGGKLRRILTDEVFAALEKRPMAYADSWSLTHFLAIRHAAEFARFLVQGALLPNSPDSADARVADFRRFFGVDLDALEREWRSYIEHL